MVLESIHADDEIRLVLQSIHADDEIRLVLQSIHADDEIRLVLQSIHADDEIRLVLQSIHAADNRDSDVFRDTYIIIPSCLHLYSIVSLFFCSMKSSPNLEHIT